MKYIEFQNQFKNHPIIHLSDIKNVEPDFDHRRLYEWQKKGYLKKVINNFYVFANKDLSEAESNFIANKLIEPSYLSMEYALNYYSLIPEIVFLRTSVTSRKTKSFNTAIGNFSYQKVKNDLTRLFHDSSAILVTTMFDYYGLPTDFPAYAAQHGNCYQKVKHLEDAFGRDINKQNFLPYLQLHEFEALLFSSTQDIIDTMPNSEYKKDELNKIRYEFNSPEEINNNPQTCPSKRLLNLFPEYTKVVFGTIISSNIGLDVIRNECSHFNDWFTKLESV